MRKAPAHASHAGAAAKFPGSVESGGGSQTSAVKQSKAFVLHLHRVNVEVDGALFVLVVSMPTHL